MNGSQNVQNVQQKLQKGILDVVQQRSTKPTVIPSKEEKVVNIVIVGAGPATLGLMCNAVKTNRLKQLLQTENGIAILEKGTSFGGGCLQYFGINSNTSANGFMKCTYLKKETVASQQQAYVIGDMKKANRYLTPMKLPSKGVAVISSQKKPDIDVVNSDEEDAIDSERDEPPAVEETKLAVKKVFNFVAYDCFRELVNVSEIFQVMNEYGSSIVPLSMVGMYMNYAGNHLLNYIYHTYKQKIFHHSHKVVSIQLLANGDVLTSTVRRYKVLKQSVVIKDAKEYVQFHEEMEHQAINFRSKAVVVSNGGKQTLHPYFYKIWFPFMKLKKERVILSDQFMRKDVYKATMEKIHQDKLKNIVIIGGSASGFSTAWLMINGPATYYRNNVGRSKNLKQFPGAKLKSIPNCRDCCLCHNLKVQCRCICKCFGHFQYKDWDFDYTMLPKHFEVGSIKILYRDKIRVFYPTVAQAKQDGYTDYNDKIFSRKDGYLYSYTGLRGNAKNLYKRIINGTEKRIKLVQASSYQEQRSHVDQADLVVWACGYQTKKIPFKDHEGKEIPVSQLVPFTQYDVDAKCRIQTSDGSVFTKTFGTGIAYPTRTNDGMQIKDNGKPNPRADSFSLYCNWVANRVLISLLQQNLLVSKMHRTIKNRLLVQNQEPTNKQRAQTTVRTIKVKKISKIWDQQSPEKKQQTTKINNLTQIEKIPIKAELLTNQKKPKFRQLLPIKNVQEAAVVKRPLTSIPAPKIVEQCQQENPVLVKMNKREKSITKTENTTHRKMEKDAISKSISRNTQNVSRQKFFSSPDTSQIVEKPRVIEQQKQQAFANKTAENVSSPPETIKSPPNKSQKVIKKSIDQTQKEVPMPIQNLMKRVNQNNKVMLKDSTAQSTPTPQKNKSKKLQKQQNNQNRSRVPPEVQKRNKAYIDQALKDYQAKKQQQKILTYNLPKPLKQKTNDYFNDLKNAESGSRDEQSEHLLEPSSAGQRAQSIQGSPKKRGKSRVKQIQQSQQHQGLSQPEQFKENKKIVQTLSKQAIENKASRVYQTTIKIANQKNEDLQDVMKGRGKQVQTASYQRSQNPLIASQNSQRSTNAFEKEFQPQKRQARLDKSAPRIPEATLQVNLKERQPPFRVKNFLPEQGESEIYSTPQKLLGHRRNSPVAVSANGFSNTYYLLNIHSPTKAHALNRQYSSKSDFRGLDAIIHNTRPITSSSPTLRSVGSERRIARHSLPTTLINEIQQLRQINDEQFQRIKELQDLA